MYNSNIFIEFIHFSDEVRMNFILFTFESGTKRRCTFRCVKFSFTFDTMYCDSYVEIFATFCQNMDSQFCHNKVCSNIALYQNLRRWECCEKREKKTSLHVGKDDSNCYDFRLNALPESILSQEIAMYAASTPMLLSGITTPQINTTIQAFIFPPKSPNFKSNELEKK